GLHFTTPNGTAIEIPNLVFPYGQEHVEYAIQGQLNLSAVWRKKEGSPIAWSVEDHGDYYIFKCIVDTPENEHTNHSRADGVVGLDLNVDHIAWSNINPKGQLVSSGVFRFDVTGKSTGQAIKWIEAEAIAVVDLAVQLNKPIVLENWTPLNPKFPIHMETKRPIER
ncbi:transposase, partial [Bacillus sp. IITD106]|nr:transposase [Bacillus sp. IITD106]